MTKRYGSIILLGLAILEGWGQEHWSLRPVVRPQVPQVKGSAMMMRNPVDAFVLRRLGKKNLQPSPEANRRTLIRRLYFNLLGLPPKPGAMKSFVNDPDPKAYENLVDILLASPHYG